MADINVSGALIPTTSNTPLDKRSRVSTLADIANIAYPYVGLVVFVEDTKKRYIVTELKSKQVGTIEIPNSLVKTYKEIDADVASQIQSLQSQIDELKGGEGSEAEQSEEIDSNEEVKSFLSGFSNEDNLKDILDSKDQPLDDDEMASLKALFPTS